MVAHWTARRMRYRGRPSGAIAAIEAVGPFAKVARQPIARIRARTISAMNADPGRITAVRDYGGQPGPLQLLPRARQLWDRHRLCGQTQLANFLKYAPEIGVWRNAHGSIMQYEGEVTGQAGRVRARAARHRRAKAVFGRGWSSLQFFRGCMVPLLALSAGGRAETVTPGVVFEYLARLVVAIIGEGYAPRGQRLRRGPW